MDRQRTGGTALATRPPVAISPNAGYLANLKPILDIATQTRGSWLRILADLSKRQDLENLYAEVLPVANDHFTKFVQARRLLGELAVPLPYVPMHDALVAWISALEGSCAAIGQAKPPLQQQTLIQARRAIQAAAQQATRFNEVRAELVTKQAEAAAEEAEGGEGRFAFLQNRRRLMIVGGVLIVLILLGLYLSGVLGGSRASLLSGTPTPGTQRRTFTQPEVFSRLQQEIAARQVAFQDPSVRLVPPDRVFVGGRIQGPASIIPIEVELQVAATEDGKPRVNGIGVSAVGVTVPISAIDALNKRVEEGNVELAKQVPPDQRVRRVFVEENMIVAEIEIVAPDQAAKPGDAAAKPGDAAAKPGDAAAKPGDAAAKPADAAAKPAGEAAPAANAGTAPKPGP